MVFVVVVVVFEKWSGPVNGFGCTRSISGAQFWCVCVYFNSSGNVGLKRYYERKGGIGFPLFFCRFLMF